MRKLLLIINDTQCFLHSEVTYCRLACNTAMLIIYKMLYTNAIRYVIIFFEYIHPSVARFL